MISEGKEDVDPKHQRDHHPLKTGKEPTKARQGGKTQKPKKDEPSELDAIADLAKKVDGFAKDLGKMQKGGAGGGQGGAKGDGGHIRTVLPNVQGIMKETQQVLKHLPTGGSDNPNREQRGEKPSPNASGHRCPSCRVCCKYSLSIVGVVTLIRVIIWLVYMVVSVRNHVNK